MFKIIGGVMVGIFLGAFVLELLKRKRPDLVKDIEAQAKAVSDKLFDNLREDFDFRKAEGEAEG
jgi:hypothetical protein